MTKIIAIANQKGGVGKTTTAVNLASYLAYFGQETLLIDMDPQANTTSGFGIDKTSLKRSSYDVIINNSKIEDAIMPSGVDWLDIIPANRDLIGAEVELVNTISRETRLKKAFRNCPENYRFILIDCPPSLSLLTLNSLTLANSVLIPIQAEFYPLEGLTELMNTVNLIREDLNPVLEIEGVLLTMYDTRLTLSSQVIKEIGKFFSDRVYQTIVPRNVRLAEAPSFGKPVIFYAPESKGAKAYQNLAREVLKGNGIELKEGPVEEKSKYPLAVQEKTKKDLTITGK